MESVLGPEGVAAAEAAGRSWARVWGRLPLLDGKSLRELVAWRGHSLLWGGEAFLREETTGPRCARTVETALRLLDATSPAEVDTSGLAAGDALLLARACTARGVLFHGPAPATGRPLALPRPPAPPRGLRRAIGDALAPGAPPPLPAPGGSGGAVVVLAAGDAGAGLPALARAIAADPWLHAVVVTLADLPRWETRRVRRAVSAAEALLREQLTRLRGTPGLAASYAHRGVRFDDLAAGDLEALLLGHLPVAVRRTEAAIELLASARARAAVLAVPGRDERRSLLHACASVGVPAVAVRPAAGNTTDVPRVDGGPQPVATVEWEPGEDPGPVLARIREAARGRVGAG